VAQEYRAGLVEQIATLQPEVASLDALLAGLPAQAVELGRRQRDVRLLSEVLVMTEQRVRQEELREALTYSNVQVIDAAALRDRPVWPRKKLGLVVVLLLAGGTAFLAMVVRERSDGRVRTGAAVRELLDVPVMAVLLRGRDGRIALSPAQARVVLRRVPGDRLLLTGAGSQIVAEEIAEALTAPGNGLVPPGASPLPARNGHPWNALAIPDHATATEVASAGVGLAVVVEVGRTPVRDLVRLRRLLEEARAPVSGVILVCRSRADEEAVWE
jgi:hypothetical protein